MTNYTKLFTDPAMAPNGFTAIRQANSIEMLRLLFQHGAQISPSCAASSSSLFASYRNPICDVMHNGKIDFLEEYFKYEQVRAIVNTPNCGIFIPNTYPLSEALQRANESRDPHNYVELVRLLLEAGANPLEQVEGRSIFLMYCSQEFKDMMWQALVPRIKNAMEEHNLDTLKYTLLSGELAL